MFMIENRVKKQIKHLLLDENCLLKELAEKLTEKTGRKYTSDSLSHRIARAKITYDEMVDIAEILGYDINFVKKQTK